uniref:Uncharacterized protein n=1 Tax=Rhizophora mucronata TaxID=61149 RepID=A0A2P2NSH0_RHIMU
MTMSRKLTSTRWIQLIGWGRGTASFGQVFLLGRQRTRFA